MRTLFVAVLLALSSLPATADTILVDVNGGGDYLTIQEGIDAAAEGDTVLVAPGTYEGAGNVELDFGGTNLVLRSIAGCDSTFIDGGEDEVVWLTSGEDTTSIFAGFSCASTGWGSVRLGGAGLTVEDCFFEEKGIRVYDGVVIVRRTDFEYCATGYGGGITCWGSTVLVEDTEFDSCYADQLSGYGEGIFFSQCDATIRRSRFQQCWHSMASARGVLYATDSSVVLSDVTFWDNDAFRVIDMNGGELHCSGLTAVGNSTVFLIVNASALVEESILAFNGCPVWDSPQVEIQHSCIFGNATGDSLFCVHSENVFADPQFCDVTTGLFTLAASSPCLPDNNQWGVHMGAEPYGCSPRSIHVSPDGTGNFPTIQAAIDSADVWDEVVLAEGVYAGDGNRDLDYGGKRITVRSESGDPTLCIIDCGGSPEEPHRGVLFDSGETWESELKGVTITGGYAEEGGAIKCGDARASIIDCVIAGNEAVSGGGIYTTGHIMVNECMIRSNAADVGGGVTVASTERTGLYSRPMFDHCTVVGNTAPIGAGIHRSGALCDVCINSIVAFNGPGEGFWSEHIAWSDTVALYTDIYGNEGGDWAGEIEDLIFAPGNMCVDPVFCGSDAYLLEDCSPCIGTAWGGGNIGAGDIGCPCGDPTGVPATDALLRLVSVTNPVNDVAQFSYYRVGSAANIRLNIYNVVGRKVAEYAERAPRAGLGEIAWDGRDTLGNRVAAGVYMYRLTDGQETVQGRLTIVR